MRPKSRKQAAHQARKTRKAAKQRATYKAETKRARTRAQTPELWRSRVKGRAVRARPPVIAIPHIWPKAA